jgi:hypothetical protein
MYHGKGKKNADLFKVELFPRYSSSGSSLLASSFLKTFLFSLPLGLFLLFSPFLALTFALGQQRFSVALRVRGFDLSIETRDTSGAAIILELPTPRSQNCQDLLPHFWIRRVVGRKML